MLGSADSPIRDDEASLAARAAWLHYAGGMTQADVAKRLGLSGLKAHRLITKANREGLVKVFIDGDVAECVELENALSARYGLDYCEVVPDIGSEDLPLKALGMAGAQFLKREIEKGDEILIGVAHGRTLAACVQALPRVSGGRTRFVSLLGGVTRKFAANPYDVIHRLAERTGSEAYVMPVPFFANSAEDRSVLLGQHGVEEVFEMARRSDLVIAGIGTAVREASLVSTGMIELAEIEEIRQQGGVGEMLGHFFDRDGGPIETSLSHRTLALPREDLQGKRTVAVAGGEIKVPAIRSILKSGYLKGLITDELTAGSLAADEPAAGNGRDRRP